ncbi:MAG: hypothetical protein AAF702_34380 [Chloroflexota bacterium]
MNQTSALSIYSQSRSSAASTLSKSRNWIDRPFRWLFVLASLALLWTFSVPDAAFAQETSLTPLGGSIYGNYCTASGGIGLKEDPFTGTFSVNVPGNPVAAYWYWSGRTDESPHQNDTQIAVSLNGASDVILSADQSISSAVIYGQTLYNWHMNVYEDDTLSLVTPNSLNSFTISELTLNGPTINFENHGAGVLIIYEHPTCPFQKIDVTYGLDSFHHSQTVPYGPDSEVFCTTFQASAVPQSFSIDMFIGGVAADTRGNSIWYITGSGTPAYTTLVDDLSASEIVDPLNVESGLEWDMHMENITIDPGETHACFQIESPEADDGISSIWIGTSTGLTQVQPSIVITKTPDIQVVSPGTDVSFVITVENTSPYTLTSVQVTDPLWTDCELDIGTMVSGGITTYDCPAGSVEESFVNTAFVTGLSPFQTTVSDQDDAQVFVAAIEINKTPDLQSVRSGSDVTFTIQVTNTGDVPLDNVTVTDIQTPSCDRNLGTLDVGQASTPYTCVATNVTSAFTNEATVVGTPEVGDSVTDSDIADVLVFNPAIVIEKTPELQTVAVGAPVTFTIQVTNTGDITLTNVTVDDALAPLCDNVWASMAPGETQSYTCVLDPVTASFTNEASVMGTAPDGSTVSDTDTADVVTQDLPNDPAIDIQKTPDDQTILSGGFARFDIQVQNSGNVTLTNVTITDPLAPACDRTFPQLLVAEVTEYECILDNVTADFTNVVTVTGTSPSNIQVTDSDNANVTVVTPAIDISKAPDVQTVLPGDPVQFSITVTNTGSVDLINVNVEDALATECNRNLGTLAAGESTSYQCTLPSATNSFTNVAVVTGDPVLGGPPVTATDTAEVIVILPAIDITKTPDNQTVVQGTPVTFTIRVENTGTVTLTNVTVSDPLVSDCDRTFAQLIPGGVEEYSCQLDSVQLAFTNVASVTGTPPLGDDVSDQDDAVVGIVLPGLEIIKSPDLQLTLPNGSVNFTITVRNTGNSMLTNVTVTDPLAPDCNQEIDNLGPGLVSEYVCTLNNVQSDLTNTASVSGQSPNGDTLTDEDTAAVVVVIPSIAIDKRVAQSEVQPGEDALFTIVVTNTGTVVLNNVVVSDTLAPGCNRDIGTLAPTNSFTYDCTLSNIQASLINVADVVGVPPLGPSVTDQDDATVTVPSADLRIVKTDGGTTTEAGGTITYTFSYQNLGRGNAFDVVVTEAVPDFTTFDPAASNPNWVCAGGATSAGTTCTYAIGDLAAGASSDIALEFVVIVDDPLPNTIDRILNFVTITGRNNVAGNNTSEDNTPLTPTGLDTVPEPQGQSDPVIYIPLMNAGF